MRGQLIRWFQLTLALMSITLVVSGCMIEKVSIIDIIIENQTDQVLVLYEYSELDPYSIEYSKK